MYTAIVHGILREKEGVISSYLTENTAYKIYSTTDPSKGKLAETGFKVIKESQNFSLLDIVLHTGKKHQIRVQLADKGHPVAGDKLYGEKNAGTKRLALHASSLTISHPFTKEKMTFEAPLPAYFKTLMKDKHQGDFT